MHTYDLGMVKRLNDAQAWKRPIHGNIHRFRPDEDGVPSPQGAVAQATPSCHLASPSLDR